MKKIFNNSKFVYITTKRHKVGKLSLREKSMKDKNTKCYFCLYNAEHVNLVGGGEGLETAAIWFLPSCALKYLNPTGRNPCSQ